MTAALKPLKDPHSMYDKMLRELGKVDTKRKKVLKVQENVLDYLEKISKFALRRGYFSL